MEEVTGGDTHRSSRSSASHKNTTTRIVASIAVVAVVAIVGFLGGIAYNKGHATNTSATNASARFGISGSAGGRFGGQRPTFGTVTAISPTSITVQSTQTASSSTLAITSSTTISDSGQTVTSTDIQTGDTVAITASTTNSSDAARILVNPSFGGYGGGGSGTAPTTTQSE